MVAQRSASSDYDVTIVCVNPDNSFNLRTHVPLNVLGDRYVIGYWYWELPEMPDEWMPEFEFTDEVWAATNFVKDAVASKSPAPVVRIPPVVQLGQGRNLSRADLRLPENRFVFLAMFDAASVLQRKNPLGVLRAFKKAFAADDAEVALVLKFNNPDHNEPVFQAVLAESATHENVLLLDKPMDKDEVTSLIKASDCFVSLHRSEGFGLGPAEAMSLGKPAIITNWSGNTDYMTAENCIADRLRTGTFRYGLWSIQSAPALGRTGSRSSRAMDETNRWRTGIGQKHRLCGVSKRSIRNSRRRRSAR